MADVFDDLAAELSATAPPDPLAVPGAAAAAIAASGRAAVGTAASGAG